MTCTFPFTCGSSIAVDDHSVLAGTSLLKKMKDKNTTPSEQYHNQIWKSQKEEKPMHLTHKYKQYQILIAVKIPQYKSRLKIDADYCWYCLIHCVHTSAGGLLLPEFHTHFRVGVFVTVEDSGFYLNLCLCNVG